jgi:hypothetical protein
MKIIGNRVLVEQTSIKSESLIIMTEKNKGNDLVITFKVLQLGNECPTTEGHVKVGDIPIFSEHVTFSGHKTIDVTKAPNGEVTKLVAHTIVYYDDIIATEND